MHRADVPVHRLTELKHVEEAGVDVEKEKKGSEDKLMRRNGPLPKVIKDRMAAQ